MVKAQKIIHALKRGEVANCQKTFEVFVHQQFSIAASTKSILEDSLFLVV